MTDTYKHIFLLSHMRANTSLLGHILGSHPQINGYYEMHLSYKNAHDLLRQQQLYASKEAIKPGSQYFFDKLLHNDYQLLPDQLGMENLKILVSVRSAEQTIKSIINLFAKKNTGHSYAEPCAATDYYIQRIARLAEFCACNKQRYYYFDADLIRTQAQQIFSRLQNWLALATPLSEQYQLFSLTGKPGAGDSSENMNKGRIIKQPGNYDRIELPEQLLFRAETETRVHKELIIANALEAVTL